MQQAIGSVAQVKYFVSDRAKALVKLALEGLGCHSIPDLFHALRDLSKHIGPHLGRQLSQVEQQMSQADQKLTQLQASAKPSFAQQQCLRQLQSQYSLLKSTQETYHKVLQQLSLCMHPFAIDGSGFQSATEVASSLEHHLQALAELSKVSELPNLQAALNKFTDQISGLTPVINTWWTWVFHSLSTEQLSPQVSNWVLTCLVPMVYWQQQMHKTKTPALKQAYQSAFAQAQKLYSYDPITVNMSDESLQHWWSWAEWMVSKFQRTSSPVEGRNGYLSRIHHGGRGLPARRLQVLTVIHNFALHRADGSTAAYRLFRRQFPDLFEYIVEHMGELPLPRIARKPTRARIAEFTCCPGLSG